MNVSNIPADKAAGKRGRILIVDDNPANLRLLMRMLAQYDYIVHPASDGESALRFVELMIPDIILLDIMMPGMNGYQLCERLKSDERTRDIPVIFISAMDQELDKLKAFSKGGVDYIVRPLQQEEVLARIRTHLSLRNLRDHLKELVAERTAELIETNLTLEKRTSELERANAELIREVNDRIQAEKVLREAKDELAHASKLAVLGQMSVGVAHEINQPLTALRALSYNTRLRLKRGQIENIDKNLQSISELTDRMGRITEQLKSFARKTPVAITPVLLESVVKSAISVLENRIGAEQIDLQIDIPPGLLTLCDANQLEQIFLNLFANALDAMKNTSIKALSVHARIVDFRVLVRVSDSGTGIMQSTMSHLFEPFFSTKPAGEGLGLGLVISANIVREFGGTLRALDSSAGAIFEFDLKLGKENNNA